MVHGQVAGSMIARGATLDTDREIATGSLHVLRCRRRCCARIVALEPTTGQACTGSTRYGDSRSARTLHVGVLGQGSDPRFLIIGRSHLRRPGRRRRSHRSCRAADRVWSARDSRLAEPVESRWPLRPRIAKPSMRLLRTSARGSPHLRLEVTTGVRGPALDSAACSNVNDHTGMSRAPPLGDSGGAENERRTVEPLLPVLLMSPIHPPVKGNVELTL